jgi:serine O-acetyltransferase
MNHWASLKADIHRTWSYVRGGKLRRSLECLRAPGVQTMIVFRYGQWARSMPLIARLVLDPIYFILNGYIQIVWGIELPRAATVGPGLYIGHYGGITISPRTVIGSHCNISQNITIGLSGKGEKRGVPVIGDYVYIAPGARLFGKITIGNNVKIGANAVIHKSIPDNAVAVLDPGFKIIEGAEPNPRSSPDDPDSQD